ncbi:MAG: oligoendopeptidase F, partial [Deltaproteobacteria bacterium]|nr:oligoendopeptidase F [Deltaproteobacteria bacterium]
MKRRTFAASIVISLTALVLVLNTPSVHAAYKPDSNAKRTSVPSKYKWNTSALFKNDGAWGGAFKAVERGVKELQPYKGKLGDAANLKRCLDAFFDVKLKLSYVALYAELKVAEDKEVERYQKMFQRTQNLSKDFNTKTSFILESILRMDDSKMKALLADKGLGLYGGAIEDMRRRRSRIMDADTERVLNMAGDVLFASSWLTSDIEQIFKAVMRDINFPKIKDEDGQMVQLNLSNYSKYRASKNRDVRKGAVDSFLGSLRKYQNIFAAALAGEIKRDVFFAKARKYDKTIEAYLDADNIDSKVVDNLIDTIHSNLKPLHRYVALRKKILKIPSVHLYDLYTPIIKDVETDISYEEGSRMILESLKPLGNEYVETVKTALAPGSGWVDVYPSQGKQSGAFSASVWNIHPFIKMNYQNEIDDVSTLTHELGHTMHSYLNMKVQPYVNFGYSTFTAEIASTFNETLLNKYLTKKYENDDDMRFYILGNLLEQIRTTIYRQTLFAEFEKKIHEFAETGTPITAKLLNKTYIDLVKRYYGPGFTIDKNDNVEWAFIPHFYYKYYVFTYATGLSSGIALATKVLDEGDAARDKYIDMLQSSAHSPPLEILKKAGADLTKPYVIKAAANLMNET